MSTSTVDAGLWSEALVYYCAITYGAEEWRAEHDRLDPIVWQRLDLGNHDRAEWLRRSLLAAERVERWSATVHPLADLIVSWGLASRVMSIRALVMAL